MNKQWHEQHSVLNKMHSSSALIQLYRLPLTCKDYPCGQETADLTKKNAQPKYQTNTIDIMTYLI